MYDVFSDDYVVKQSPFAVAGKAAHQGPIIGYGKRNPNEARRKKR